MRTLEDNNYCFVQVVVLDFPPRLTADADHQKLMREEFHRVAARMGMFRKKCGLSVVAYMERIIFS